MDILPVICNRRSVRKYKKEMPSDTDIEKILEAGRWAPSGLNNQPWRFLVIKDEVQKNELVQFTNYGNIIKQAPLIIIVFMNLNDCYNRDKDLMAMGACIQNMLIEVHSIGLSACWLGEILNKKNEIRKFLKKKADLEIMAVITIGYSDEKIGKGQRKPLKNLKIEG